MCKNLNETRRTCQYASYSARAAGSVILRPQAEESLSITHSFDAPALPWPNDSTAQLFNRRLRLLEVLRVKPFSEPDVNLGQHLVSLLYSALPWPQAGEAHRRA